jgi:hypothetical protein
MAYTINRTDGTAIQVSAGLINTTDFSVQLIGKNSADYGKSVNENFLRLAENFASDAQPTPTTTLTGQLWYDKTNQSLKVYNGSTYKSLGMISTLEPGTPRVGELWLDMTSDAANPSLKIYGNVTTSGSTSSRWLRVGENTYSGTGGTSGAVTGPITASDNSSKNVTAFYIDGNVLAILSKEPFVVGTDSTSLTSNIRTSFGLATPQINAGLTFTSPNIVLSGTANNSNYLGGLTSSDFVRRVATSQTVGGTIQFTTNSDDGVSFGNLSQLRIVGGGGLNTEIRNTQSGGDLIFKVVSSLASVETLRLYSNTSVGVLSISKMGTDGTGNIGSSTNGFNTVFARATSAQYADLAECFAADAEYPAGTLVKIGGSSEITIELEPLSSDVLGVVSTEPAYLMNDTNYHDARHPAIAMVGRVPVRVVGAVAKGQRLVSAGFGLARGVLDGDVTQGTVIGRSLEDNATPEEKLVEAIVKINI